MDAELSLGGVLRKCVHLVDRGAFFGVVQDLLVTKLETDAQHPTA